jgi:hypothetical protein
MTTLHYFARLNRPAPAPRVTKLPGGAWALVVPGSHPQRWRVVSAHPSENAARQALAILRGGDE